MTLVDMFWQRVLLASLIAISTWAPLLPGTVTLAQEPPLEPDDPSPATRHAEVIAHGVAAMPADELGWRLTTARSLPPTRADAAERAAGFILADKSVVAVVDEDGQRLARIAPGEASWTEPGVARAVVGIERKAPDYYDIALVPASQIPESDPIVTNGAPFAAPSGDAFDIDLIRDVLDRTEENVVSTGPSPALLLVTDGAVFVESTSSGPVEMATGEAAQIAGDVVITGASRSPAAFVVARIGTEVVSILEDTTRMATPAPFATPVTVGESASLSLSASLCPTGYAGGNASVECISPAGGVGFSLIPDDAVTATVVTNGDGDISFTGLEPGYYTVSTERSTDFSASRVRCRNESGDDLAARTTTNRIAILLVAGDDFTCTWYLIPARAQGEASPTPTVPEPAETDSDQDGLTDALEAELGTDPTRPDSDADGVSDSDEIDFYSTDALDPDTDDDGLDDAEELLNHGANPLLADTDDDGISDGEEVAAGSDLLDASSMPATPTPIPTATPEPTLEPTPEPTPEATPEPRASPLPSADVVELASETKTDTERELEPHSIPSEDLDGDGLSNAAEVSIHGTNVAIADSDGDGVGDGIEVASGTDPLDSKDS